MKTLRILFIAVCLLFLPMSALASPNQTHELASAQHSLTPCSFTVSSDYLVSGGLGAKTLLDCGSNRAYRQVESCIIFNGNWYCNTTAIGNYVYLTVYSSHTAQRSSGCTVGTWGWAYDQNSGTSESAYGLYPQNVGWCATYAG